jgi:hypothetical protein
MDPDDDVRAVEQRIARGRNGLAALAENCEETARDAIASPKSLLAVAAVGFMLGEMLRPSRRSPPTRKAGLAGMLLGAAVALVRARYGNPWSLAELAWSHATAARHAPRRSSPDGPTPRAQQQPQPAAARPGAPLR